jgi:GntR family transcriptional regulator
MDGYGNPREDAPGAPVARRPLHGVIRDALRDAIRRGDFPEGELLPSEQDIGQRFGASRITVRHALQGLESEGYVLKQHGRRTQVLSREPGPRPVWQIDTLDDLIASAGDASLRILGYRSDRSEEGARALGLKPDSTLWCLRSLLVRRGRPYARSIIYFPPEIGSQLTLSDFDDVIVFRVLASRLRIAVADVTMTVRAGKADADDVRQLECRRGEPMLTTQLVYRPAQGQAPVEVAFTRFPAEGYSLSYSLTARASRS